MLPTFSSMETDLGLNLRVADRFSINDNDRINVKMRLEDTVKKWVFFFRLLDSNRDGVLEPSDIELIIDRLLATKPGLFDNTESSYLKFITLKSFDRLLLEAGSGKERKITLLDWVRMIKKSNTDGKRSYFIRWFSASAVRFLFDLCDHNKDGFIDFDEFETIYKILGMNRGNIIFAFRELDHNRDGKLSKAELYDAISSFFSVRDGLNQNYVFGQFKTLSDEYISKLVTV